MTASTELYDWFLLVQKGKISEARRNIYIILLNERGNDVARWEFIKAWPKKYVGPSLNVETNEIATESLEIVHEGMRRV